MAILASIRTTPSLELKYYTRLKGALVLSYANIREIREDHKRLWVDHKSQSAMKTVR